MNNQLINNNEINNRSHYLELLKVDEEAKRNFYIKETINSRWSVRELQRQIGSLLYERLVLSSNKEKILELAEKGHELKESKDLVLYYFNI